MTVPSEVRAKRVSLSRSYGFSSKMNISFVEMSGNFQAVLQQVMEAVPQDPFYPVAAALAVVPVALAYTIKKCFKGRNGEEGCILSNIHYFAGLSPDISHTEKCISLLQKYPHFVNMPLSEDQYLSHGYTPFLRACWNNNYELIHYMYRNGADLRITNSDGESAMYLVAYRVSKSQDWDPRALNLLWNAGCSVDDTNVHSNSMLHLAAKAGCTTLARWLVLHGADPEVRNNAGYTPRTLALKKGTPAHRVVADVLRFPGERSRCRFVMRSDAIEVLPGDELDRTNTEPIHDLPSTCGF